jgi:hypothetical protein
MEVDLCQLHGAGSRRYLCWWCSISGPLQPLVLQRRASSPANQQENRRSATSVAAPSTTSAAALSLHSRGIICHKCQGRGHIAVECPSKRTLLVNE